MGLFNEIYGKVPEYYPTMYMDGFTPEQIRYALKKKILREYEDAHTINEIKITSRVKIK